MTRNALPHSVRHLHPRISPALACIERFSRRIDCLYLRSRPSRWPCRQIPLPSHRRTRHCHIWWLSPSLTTRPCSRPSHRFPYSRICRLAAGRPSQDYLSFVIEATVVPVPPRSSQSRRCLGLRPRDNPKESKPTKYNIKVLFIAVLICVGTLAEREDGVGTFRPYVLAKTWTKN